MYTYLPKDNTALTEGLPSTSLSDRGFEKYRGLPEKKAQAQAYPHPHYAYGQAPERKKRSLLGDLAVLSTAASPFLVSALFKGRGKRLSDLADKALGGPKARLISLQDAAKAALKESKRWGKAGYKFDGMRIAEQNVPGFADLSRFMFDASKNTGSLRVGVRSLADAHSKGIGADMFFHELGHAHDAYNQAYFKPKTLLSRIWNDYVGNNVMPYKWNPRYKEELRAWENAKKLSRRKISQESIDTALNTYRNDIYRRNAMTLGGLGSAALIGNRFFGGEKSAEYRRGFMDKLAEAGLLEKKASAFTKMIRRMARRGGIELTPEKIRSLAQRYNSSLSPIDHYVYKPLSEVAAGVSRSLPRETRISWMRRRSTPVLKRVKPVDLNDPLKSQVQGERISRALAAPDAFTTMGTRQFADRFGSDVIFKGTTRQTLEQQNPFGDVTFWSRNPAVAASYSPIGYALPTRGSTRSFVHGNATPHVGAYDRELVDSARKWVRTGKGESPLFSRGGKADAAWDYEVRLPPEILKRHRKEAIPISFRTRTSAPELPVIHGLSGGMDPGSQMVFKVPSRDLVKAFGDDADLQYRIMEKYMLPGKLNRPDIGLSELPRGYR